MKISVGTNYEGKSNDFSLEDGEYEFQIIRVEQTKGRVNMTMVTPNKRFVYKTFFLRNKDGSDSDKGYRELADFITTAMRIEEPDIQVDITDAIGYYFKAYLKNSSYEYVDDEGITRVKKNYWINHPERLVGFSNGTPSLLEWANSKKKNRKPVQEEDTAEEVAEESATSDVDSTLEDLLGM